MIKDPIVEEVHRLREQLLAEHGSSAALLDHLQAHPPKGAGETIQDPVDLQRRFMKLAS